MATIQVTMLGTGAWIADQKKKRFGPSVLLKIGGKNIVVDAPAGVHYQLAKAGLVANNIDCIFLTHHRPDHTSGLVQLIGEMYITKRKTPLTVVSRDCERFYKSVLKPYKKTFDSLAKFSKLQVKFREIGNGGITGIGGTGLAAKISAYRLEHSENYADYGYRFKTGAGKGKVIAVSGDTAYCDALVKLVSGADLAVCECSHVQKIPGHMTAYELKTLSLFAKRLVPYHMYPGWDAKKEFAGFGNIHVARDLEKIKF